MVYKHYYDNIQRENSENIDIFCTFSWGKPPHHVSIVYRKKNNNKVKKNFRSINLYYLFSRILILYRDRGHGGKMNT